jgi:HNH endonuclease
MLECSTHLLCAECGNTFLRPSKDGPIPQWCLTCRAERARVRHREWQRSKALKSKISALPKIDTCSECGTKFPRLHSRGVRRRCESCRELHDKTRHKLYQPNRDRSPKPCELCHILITPKLVGPVARWCRPCAVRVQREQRNVWLKARPELQRAQWRAHKQRRRAAKRTTTIEYFKPIDVYRRDKWRCGICRKFVDRDLKYPHPESPSLDHIIPLAKGGTHTLDNVQLAHLQCNCLKQDKMEHEHWQPIS